MVKTAYLVCSHPTCSQPASSKVGGMEDGRWQEGYMSVSCIDHVNYFIENREIFFPFSDVVGVGVLMRR